MAKKLGDFIKNSREKAGLSQVDIADALGLSSAQYISNIERGVSPLAKKLIVKLAKTLKVDPEKIVDVILSELKDKYLRELGGRATKKSAKKR
jgi:transcriptional regulator with XRE-family HTH domain